MRSLVVLTVLLSACSVAAPPARDAEDPVATTFPDRERLEGSYLVSSVNGAAPEVFSPGRPPTVTITEDRLNFSSQCIFADWTWSRDGENFDTGPFDYGEEPVVMCARALSPTEVAIQEAIGEAQTIRRIRSGWWIDGPGGTVQLQRIPDPAELAARAVQFTGEWRVAELDGTRLAGDYPLLLTVDSEQIWWEPACASQDREYTIDGNRFATAPPPDGPVEVCDIGYPEELTRVWAAMDRADRIEQLDRDTVRISGNGRSVTLVTR